MDPLELPHELFINTILLGGSPLEKVHAAAEAGFDSVELWTTDVELFDGTPAELQRTFGLVPIRITDFQVLRDFEGAPDDLREAARSRAIDHLDTAVALGAPMILVAASTDDDSLPERIVDDLRWLADEAASRGLRVGYESLAWSSKNTTLVEAWASVRDADRDNLGIIIDPFHVFVHGRTVADLDGIPVHKVFLVQLSDLGGTVDPDEVIEIARHHRMLPGDGVFDLDGVLEHLFRNGYTGPVGLEVFSDAMKADDPTVTARRAMTSLLSVIQRAYRNIESHAA